jgi:hypothetical protein
MSFPALVGIDDLCDACGKAGGAGVSYGAGKPVLCAECMREGWRRLATVHHIFRGTSFCGFGRQSVPGLWPAWPDLHLWSELWAEVTCVQCLQFRREP